MSTRERLIDAAEQLIRERGIGAVTTKEVARATGLAEATLYRHFADKTALLLAVFGERMPNNFLDQVAALPSRAGTATVAENLTALAAAALRFFAQTAPLTAAVDADPALAAQHYGRLRELGTGPEVAARSVGTYLRAEQGLGRLRADARPEIVVTILLGVCFQQAHARHVFGDAAPPLDPEQFAAGLVATLMHGLSPPTT
jgi:AcrR family transcriptional regulator